MEYLKERKNKIIIWLFAYLAVFVTGLFLSAAIACVKEHISVNFNNIIDMFSKNSSLVWGLTFIFVALLLCWNVYYYTVLYKKIKKADIKRSKNTSYGESKFLINEKVKTDKNEIKAFNKVYPLNENKLGWVVKSQYLANANKTNYNVSDLNNNGHHLLVIGATSTGKTQKTILQSIAYNCQLKDNNAPSMVIFDPKGEIASKTGNLLRNNGYEVLVFNLRNTNYSSTWNPLFLANKNFIEAKILEQRTINNPELSDVEKINNNAKIQNLLTKVDSNISDIAFTLFNEPNSKDKFWEEQAKNIFISLYYLLVENVADLYINNKTDKEIEDNLKAIEIAENNINLPTIATLSTNIVPIQKMYDEINKYGNNDVIGIAKIKKSEYVLRKSFIYGANSFATSENTFGSIMTTIANGLAQYKLVSIQNITLTNEIELDKLTAGDKPKALYIIAPDEREETYKFATLLVDQIYKTQIDYASKNKGQCLSRKLMFYLDEFGNIPTIPKFDTMVTVSRSRGIYFCIAIQGFDQIKNKYGENQLSTIRDNMRLHIYVKTSDKATNEYYSYRSGNYTIEKSSISNNDNGSSSSTNIEKKELLTAEDIANNPNDMLLVYFDSNAVSWVKTTSFWESKELAKFAVEEFNSLYSARIFKLDEHTILFDTSAYKKVLDKEVATINSANRRLNKNFRKSENNNELDENEFNFHPDQLIKMLKIYKANQGLEFIKPALETLQKNINKFNKNKREYKNILIQSTANLISNFGIESLEVLKEILDLASKNQNIDLTIYERNIEAYENEHKNQN